MDAAAKLVEAIATLLWPLIIIATVLLFRPAIASIIESARSRSFRLKIGGQELSMEEASEQQRNLIADLQSQFVELRKQLADAAAIPPQELEAIPAIPTRRSSSVLWVDDNPKNNSYFVEQLEKLGVGVDLALSTVDGLEKLSRRTYDVVISDMGREENGRDNSRAGLDLLAQIREQFPQIPVVLFCSPSAVRRYKSEALQLGAKGISSSATELFGLLHLDELERS